MIFGLMLCFGYSDALTALAFLVMIPSAWVAFAVCVKRLHDVGLPGWLLLVIPGMAVAGMASGLLLLGLVGALGAAPECPEDNGYGPGRSHC